MTEEYPHPEALDNLEKAYIPEAKIRLYAFRDPHKSRMFRALGFSEEAGNWETLRDALLNKLPGYPAVLNKQNQYGITYEVVITVSGPGGKLAPIRTYWIREWGEECFRLTNLYINAREWRRWEENRGDPDGT